MKRKLYLFLIMLIPFATLLSSGGAYAQDPAKSEYDAATAAFPSGAYYITTEVDGITYYVSAQGELLERTGYEEARDGLFTINQISGGSLYNFGFHIEGANGHFTNTTLSDSKAVLHPGTGVFRLDTSNNRNDWESQVFYLNNEGKIAIRSCNTAFGTSSWADAGRVFWTYEVDESGAPVYNDYGNLIPCYSYEPAYVWMLKQSSIMDRVMINEINYIIDNERMVAEVTSLPDNAKYSGNVDIPSSISYDDKTYNVTSISWYAFQSCIDLTSVTIPNSVTKIYARAFSGCTGLTSITIPSSVKSIDGRTFADCTGLTDFYCYAEEVPETSSKAFDKTPIASATLHVPASALDAYKATEPWSEFGKIKSITETNDDLENYREYLNDLLDELHSRLDNADKDLRYTVAEYEAPELYARLQRLYEKVNYTENIIYQASTLEELDNCMDYIYYIQNELEYLQAVIHAFYEEYVFTAITVEGIEMIFRVISEEDKTVQVGGYGQSAISQNTEGEITIPAEVKGYKVITIATDAFFDCRGLTSITVPKSVTSIENSAFRACTGLTSIKVEEGNTNYDSRDNCNAIIETATNTLITGCENTVIPGSVTSIGESAFYLCRGLTSITIPNNVTSISPSAFLDCSGLTSIKVEERNTYYDSRNNCNAIIETSSNTLIVGCQNTFIPNSVTSIGNYAFRSRRGLTSVQIPNSVTNIGKDAFLGCSDLTSVTIPNSVTNIGDGAFDSCSGLTSIIIPNSVITIGDGAFLGCCGLTSVTIPNSMNSITRYTFYGCSGLTSITIPNSVTSIGDEAFLGCRGLTSVTIPNSVTSIGESAFLGCSGLTSVTIGSEVTNIGDAAFWSCSSLTDVWCYAERVPSTESYTFSYSIISSATLHVPAASVEAYRTTEPWSGFGAIVPLETDVFTAKTKEGVTMTFKVLDKEKMTCQVGNGEEASVNVATSGQVTIPEVVNDYKVTTISSNSFYGAAVTEVTIPESVTTIESKAFGNNRNLEAITSESLTPFDFDDDAFDNPIYDITIMNVPQASISAYQSSKAGQKFSNVQSSSVSGSHVLGARFNVPVWKDHIMTFQVIGESACQVGNGEVASVYTGTAESIRIPQIEKGLVVKAIGRRGFYNCAELTRVYLSEDIEEIGDEAFYGCVKLRTLDLPRKVKKISPNAFHNSGLSSGGGVRYHPGQEHLIPEGVNYEQMEPDEEDYEDTREIHILASMKRISEKRAFSNCRNIVKMWVDDGNPTYDSREDCNAIIRTEDNNLLYGCQNTVIPKSVTAINDYAFEGHWFLAKIKIPAKITNIGESAFAGCTLLEQVYSYIQNPSSINDNTFSNNTYEKATLYVPYGKYEQYRATNGWKKFKNIVEMDPPQDIIAFADPLVKEICVENWDTDDDGELTETEAKEVTTLGRKFRNKNITSFDELKYFTRLTTISDYAFEGCSILASIFFPENLTSIGEYAFKGCSSLASINLPNDVTSIGNYAFEGCSSLASIFLYYGLTSIGDYAFHGCSGLTFVTIPSSVTSIGDAAFSGCTALLTITSHISEPFAISDDTFSDDTYQNATLTVPAGTKELYQATAGWKNFFRHDNILEDMNEGDVFTSKTKEGIEIAFKVLNAQDRTCQIISPAIDKATAGSITIPEFVKGYSVTSIDDEAFKDCNNLTSVTIPSSVTWIGNQAFYGCQLFNILIKCTTPPETVGKTFFSEQSFYRTMLYIPTGSLKAYAFDNNWYQFVNIRETAMTVKQLSMQQAYTLMDANTFAYSVYDPVNNRISPITTINEDNPNHCWQVIEANGERYLYNLGAKKFVISSGNGLVLTNDEIFIAMENGKEGIVLGNQVEHQWAFVSNDRMNVEDAIIDGNISPLGETEEVVIYNLAGQRLNKEQKGINIVNGKKVLLK